MGKSMNSNKDEWCKYTNKEIIHYCEYINDRICSFTQKNCEVKLYNNGKMYAIPSKNLELNLPEYDLD
jgi:hypothetical protein